MTATNHIYDHFVTHFGFTPNPGQVLALQSLADFVNPNNPATCFILTGPAGSGKTSLIRSLISWFDSSDLGYHLAAPTGRAAQIAGKKSNTYATTLHHLLYRVQVEEDPLRVLFIPKINNTHEDIRYFLIDEASMISDTGAREGMFIQDKSLLSQILSYAKQGNPRNKIIFIGDAYQLPPVNETLSPALYPDYLRDKYNLDPAHINLSLVERTESDSYIMEKAESLLAYLNNKTGTASIHWNSTGSFSNGIRQYLNDFNEDPFGKAIMIALANSQVNALNTWARNFRYRHTNSREIMPEEWMICNTNTELEGHALFKGNHFMVLDTWKPEEFANLHFINARVEFETIHNERVSAKTKILLESVTSQNGSLSFEQEKKLIHEAHKRNRKFRESKRPADDAFVSALRARYGYALTCHKAQGGEWNHVYLHPGYRKDDLRWIYTAVTRAIDELYSWNQN